MNSSDSLKRKKKVRETWAKKKYIKEVHIKNNEGTSVNRIPFGKGVQLFGNSIFRKSYTKRCEELRASSSLVNERASNDEHEVDGTS